MRVRPPAMLIAFSLLLAATGTHPVVARSEDAFPVRSIAWDDVGPLAPRLAESGLSRDSFPSCIETLRRRNAERVREGDLDHLVFYLLQSTRFTSAAPIEPALSAKAFVDGLPPETRQAYLEGRAPAARIPGAVRARIVAFLDARDARADPRFAYFRGLVATTFPDAGAREASLQREYRRAMRFVYQKEFVAQRAPDAPGAVAALYRSRGLSTDTAVEAGFLVHQGLGVIKGLEPERRIRRVLIVGPGLDLAPRTAYADDKPLESYQPWAVIDALLSLGLSEVRDLHVVAADINPRVIEHLARARRAPPRLTLVSEIREGATLSLSAEYREYFAGLGRSLGRPAGEGNGLEKTVQVSAAVAAALEPVRLDIVTERLAPHVGQGFSPASAFDLVIATNVLPYFDDTSLVLAMANVAAMLAPDGVLLHNEPRPLLGEVTAMLGLPPVQSRHAVIATVRGAPAPLADSVFLHWRRR